MGRETHFRVDAPKACGVQAASPGGRGQKETGVRALSPPPLLLIAVSG